MILYNVTINVEDAIHADWLAWMHATHLPQVMATRKFVSYRMFRLTNPVPEDGTTYAIQYMAKTMEDYEIYRDHHGPALQKETLARYGDKFVAFRTLLEEVDAPAVA